MSPNTATTLYAGLDLAKLNLQLHLAGRIQDLPSPPRRPSRRGMKRVCPSAS